FARGSHAYVRSLNGKRSTDFQIGGCDPGLWAPEDCLARVAGLLMTRDLAREVARVNDVTRFGLAPVAKYLPPDPVAPLEIPKGLDPADINDGILRVYNQTIGPARFHEQGSNNWVADGTLTTTGNPILVHDPHRPG